MIADTLLKNFEVFAEAPGGIELLRKLILDLAVRGKLINTLENVAHSEARFIELGSVMTLEYGKPLDKSLRTVKGQIPVYGANGVKAMTGQSLVKDRGIVVGRKGSAGEVNITDGPFWPLDVTFFAKFDEATFDIQYLYYLLKSLNLPKMARGIKPGINRNDVNKLKVLSVDLSEQKLIIIKINELMALCDQLEQQQKHCNNLRIATRKSAIDEISTATTPEELETAWKRINNNWTTIADTPESVQSLRNLIYYLAVRGSLCETDTSEEPIDIPKLDGLFEVPPNWRWTRIQDVSNFVNGYAFPSGDYRENGVGVIRMSDMKDGKIVTNGMRFVSKTYFEELNPSMRVSPGDLVMGMTGATLGKPCFNLTDSTFLLNQRIGKFEPFAINPKFLGIVLLTMERKFMEISFGTGVNNLSTKQIKESIFPTPPPSEQLRIVGKVGELMALCDGLEHSLLERNELSKKIAGAMAAEVAA